MKTPSCYNREPFTDPNAGWIDVAKVGEWLPLQCAYIEQGLIKQKWRYRYRWPWFTDRCAAWDGPDVRHTVPASEEWACDGCKHLPAHARAWIRGEDGE